MGNVFSVKRRGTKPVIVGLPAVTNEGKKATSPSSVKHAKQIWPEEMKRKEMKRNLMKIRRREESVRQSICLKSNRITTWVE